MAKKSNNEFEGLAHFTAENYSREDNSFSYYRRRDDIHVMGPLVDDLAVETIDGTVRARRGDYIAIDENGFPYPIDGEHFEAAYIPIGPAKQVK